MLMVRSGGLTMVHHPRAMRIMGFVLALLVAGASIAGSTVAIEVPLQHGRLHVRDVLAGLCDALEIERPSALQQLNWSIDVRSILGRVQLHALDRLSDGALRTQLQQ